MTTHPTDSGSVPTNRRQALILAAFKTIAERGYEGLRVRDVAFQVGINGATLHHYFPTKEVLIQAVLSYCSERLHRVFQNLPGSPSQQMQHYLDKLQVMMRTEPDLFLVLAETNLRAQHGLALQFVMQQDANWRKQLTDILEAGVAQKVWGSTINPDDGALFIITLIEGAAMWLVASPDKAEVAIKQIRAWLGIE